MANIREQIAQDGKAIPLRGGFGKFNNFLPTPSPTVTPSNRPTPTQTPTQTSTQTNTRTPTRTKSRTRPETPTSTPTASVTRTPSPTYTPTATSTPTRTRTQTRTRNITQTQTPTQTRTQSRTNTQTPTVTRTITPSISPSSTSPFGVAKRSSINVLKNVDWDTVLPPAPTPNPNMGLYSGGTQNNTYITKQNSYYWDLSTMKVSSNASLNSNFWGASQSDVFNISGISFRPWYPGLEDDGYTSENYSFNTAPGATQFWNLSSGGALSDSIRNALVNVSMITPQHGVCAIHQGLSSMVGTSVYFYRHTDQAPLKRTVSAVYNLNYDSNILSEVDAGVVKLDSALPAGYKVYKVAIFDNFLANDFVLTPLPILTMGGMNVPGADTNETKQDIAMGVNNQQDYQPPVAYGIGFREGGYFGAPGAYSGQVYHKQRYTSFGVTLSGYDPSLPDKVFALQFASGDSGNPAFVLYDNELILSTVLHTIRESDAYINPTINQALSDAVDTLGNEGYSINTQNIWKA